MKWFNATGQGFALAATVSLALSGASPARPAESPAAPLGADCAPGTYMKDTYLPEPAFPEQVHAPVIKASTPYKVEVVLSGLPNARSLAFIDAGHALIAVWPGELRVLSLSDGKLSGPLQGGPEVIGGRDGGIDITLDNKFATNRTLYLVYRMLKPGQKVEPGKRPDGIGQVARARLSASGGALEDFKVIYTGGYLRRATMAKDGTLIFTSMSANGAVSRKLDSPDGKVLRINADGSIPKDNPFVGKADARGEIYDLGHRDIDGVTIGADGHVWTVEHGPRGGDELNRIEPGKDYGYPIISYGLAYSGDKINGGKTAQAGLEQPVYWWGPYDIAPASLLSYSGKMFPAWKGDLFTGALSTRRLLRLHLKNGKVVGEEHFLADRCQRIRDVREAPDGSLYVVTNDAKSEKPGEVLRITAR